MFNRPHPSREDIVRDNIEQILDETELKGNEMAKNLGVSEASFSRWRKGKHLPTPGHLRKLSNLAGIDDAVDLFEVPIALLGSPTSVAAKRRWLITHLETADDTTIEQIYPALERMLRP
jgi:transcriptional regulator with XRE-family HTH domain